MVKPKSKLKPKQNLNPKILEGLAAISDYIGKSPNTTVSWIKNYGLPATKTPDGKWISHVDLILQWFLAGHRAIVDQHHAEKAANQTADEIINSIDFDLPTKRELIQALSDVE